MAKMGDEMGLVRYACFMQIFKKDNYLCYNNITDMNKTLTILAALFFIAAVPANAQLTRERLAADINIGNGYHHRYQPSVDKDTPAPKGYRPFYISHVGRHGSRYDLGEGGAFDLVATTLSEARKAGILTAQGEELARQIGIMIDDADGMYEMLTKRGAVEHREIASRMMSRFPDVFSLKSRNQVDAVSSTVQRCILSMSNFLLEVQREKPGMQVTMDTGQKYMRYLMVWDSKGRAQQKTVGPDSDRYVQSNLNPSRLYSVLFTDEEKARSYGDPYEFCEELFTCASYTETMSLEGVVDIHSFFTPEELYVLATNDSDVFYTENGNSQLYGDVTAQQGIRMLGDIVRKADEAMASDSRRAADLRFTHDTALLPMVSLMSFSGMDLRLSQTEAHEQWCTGDMIPMGSNLQMIFYKSPKSSEILVKVLYNEQERTFSALTPVAGVYYKWSELKAYFTQRMN